MSEIKIYSPNQILFGSFWGGPVAVVYFLRNNYISLNNDEYAKKTLIVGSLFILALCGILPFLPENFPNMVIPLAYSFFAKQLSVTTQLSKEAIENNENHTFESSWKVLGVGTLALLLFLLIVMIVMLILNFIGIDSLT